MCRDVYMLHKGIPFRQVEGSKWGVNEKQMQGTRGRGEALLASDPAEQGWGASVLGALSVTLHAFAGYCPKLLSQTPKFMIQM